MVGPDVDEPTAALSLDLLWIVVGAALLIFMQAGFAMVETGFYRSKHAAHVVSTNFVIFELGFVGFFSVGYAFMFGGFAYPRRPGSSGDVGVDPGVLPLHGRLHGHHRHDPRRVDG